MSASTANDAPPTRRRRRWLRRLLVLGILLLLLSLLATWLLQPKQLVPLILDRAGKSLGLEITADGNAEAPLRGQPQLIVRRLVAREPGAKKTILRAERVLLALPWSTLRNGGKDAVIKRIELDAPVFKLYGEDFPYLFGEIRSKGYNIYAVGPAGSGRTSTVRAFLERRAAERPAPADWWGRDPLS